jgi:hopanoid biosynthesis associated radical SAM protein HpnH
MGVPVSQMWTVASYVLRQKLSGRKRYPLVLMLEPLFRCNLACAGCGKIQYPAHILKKQLTPEQCFKAAEECAAPMVSIPGGEPLLHPQINEIVDGLVARRKYVYLCTNAIKLEEALPKFKPTKYLTFSVHLDGPREEHDRAVCRDGIYDIAVSAIRAAVARGFRVTTNTTLYDGVAPERIRELFDTLAELGVEGMMISPGYSYAKAPDQEHFLRREKTHGLFRRILGNPRRGWQFNQSPLFLEFLKGNYPLECTPWGNPTYNVFGWQKPCYLLDEGYVESFAELLAATEWNKYGRSSGNPRCADCMVHSGYEPTAVDATFSSLRGLLTTARLVMFGPRRDKSIGPPSPEALAASNLRPDPAHGQPNPAHGQIVPLQLNFAANNDRQAVS